MLSTIDVFVRGEWLWIKYNQVSKSQGFQAGGPRGRGGGGEEKAALGTGKKRSTDPFNQDAGIKNPGKLQSSTDQVQLKLSICNEGVGDERVRRFLYHVGQGT